MTRARIGLLGGSFDPPHRAHVELARRALSQLPLDEVWFLPAHRPPHKRDRVISDSRHRQAMLELALEGEADLAICDVELESGEVRYSYDTVADLAQAYPKLQFFFLMGEDSFAQLRLWHRPEDLLRLAHPVVAPRPGTAKAATGRRPREAFGAPVYWLEGEEIDLSSRELRAALERGEDPPGLAPRVLAYIREHALYAGESRR